MPERRLRPGDQSLPILHREARVEHLPETEDDRTVGLAFSSEEPVERFFGNEILDHGPGSVRLERIRDGGALLLDHDPRRQIGVVESADVTQGRGRATVRFSRSPEAEQILQDVRDGIRRHVSVGYRIHRLVMEEATADDETFRAMDWEPFEISLVSVPADHSVGVGRAADPEHYPVTVERTDTMTEPTRDEQGTNETRAAGEPRVEIGRQAPPAPSADEIRRNELNRIRELEAIGQRFASYDGVEMARAAISEGATVADLRARIMDRMPAAGDLATGSGDVPAVDMPESDARRYSVLRAMQAQLTGDWRQAGLEREVSNTIGRQYGREARGFYMPLSTRRLEQRDLTAGTATSGAEFVSTDLLSSEFIEILRNVMLTRAAGARVLTGLQGDIAIPRQTGAGSAFWVTEGNAPTESTQATDQVAMAPKTVGAFTDMSRKFILQSSIDAESFVREDLATVLAIELDRAAINGSGAGAEPTGILNTAGIGDVAGGANGATPTWADIVELETDVSVANAAIGSLGYMTNAKVRGKLKTVEKASGTAQFVWTDSGATPLNGYPGWVTNQVPDDLDKGTSTGVCSAIIFGNWRDLVFGLWSAVDILVDPYTGGTAGTVRVIEHQDADIALRHAASFSAMQDALTA